MTPSPSAPLGGERDSSDKGDGVMGGWFAELGEAERCRLLGLAARVLSEVIALDEGDQLDVLSLALRAWCYARSGVT